ncbi:MAG: site-specific integrase [Erysipelotrichaceae bacterium]|nr:site-specific integrase [Erysipelotrichaceae bacterium]
MKKEKKEKKEKKRDNIRSYETKKGIRYEVNFMYDDYGIHKRYTKGGFLSSKDAKNHMILIKAQIMNEGGLKKECTKTFKQVYDEFLEIGANKYQENTITNTKKNINLSKELFKYPIAKIDYAMLQKFFNKRKKESIESNKAIKSALNRVFNFALDMDYITTNPITKVNVLGIEKHLDHDKTISYEDFLKLTTSLDNENDYIYHVFSLAIKIGYYTGLRASEIFALEKSDIDFERNIIDVNKKLVYNGMKKSEIYASHLLKNKSSCDSIPLFKDLKQLLVDWFEIDHHDVIICDENGYYLHPGNTQTRIKKYAKKLDIDFHFHMLRHTLASNLIMDNVDVKTTQEILRHSNVTTTLNIYTHVNEKHKQEAINHVFDKKCGSNVGENDISNLIN